MNIDQSIREPLSQSIFEERLNDCQRISKEYHRLLSVERKARYQILAQIYSVACTAKENPSYLWDAAKKAKVKFSDDVFLTTIKIVCKPHSSTSRFGRTKQSEWAATLKLMHHYKVDSSNVAKEIKKRGGVTKCARRWSQIQNLGKGLKRAVKPQGARMVWKGIASLMPYAVIINQETGALTRGRLAIVYGRHTGAARAILRHAIDSGESRSA